MNNTTIDETIQRVEQLYTTLTGKPPVANQSAAWVPRAVAWNQDDDLLIAVDVPGVSRDSVMIRVEAGAILVTGRRGMPWSQLPRSILGCDAPLGAFARTFQLAIRVDPQQIGARLDDGVLTVRVHATARPEPSQIPISS